MRATTLCLLLALASAGCVALPGTGENGVLPKPSPAEFDEAPPPVKPEEVNDVNAREMLRKLEKEVRFDERQARTPSE